MIRHTTRDLLSVTTYAVMSMVGIVAFLYPFWLPSVQTNAQSLGHTDDAPFMTALLICLCLAALFIDAQANSLNTKTIALLGVLIAMNSVLRFIEVSVPGPGGFTPIFFLIIMSGVVFGARFGFLMGSLTLLISALITGGVGAWLPYQMFTAGWMGLSAGWLGKFFNSRIVLVFFGAVWGFLYGAIMNIWFWPFATGSAAQYWQPGMSLSSGLQRYAAFYLATSLVWDLFAALGNVLLIVFFGEPTLRVLKRFKSRFTFLVTT